MTRHTLLSTNRAEVLEDQSFDIKQCSKALEKANKRIKDAETQLALANARVSTSHIKDVSGELKLCQQRLDKQKNTVRDCRSSYKKVVNNAKACTDKLPVQQASTHKLITEAVSGLNKAFETKQCPGIKPGTTLVSHRKAGDVIVITNKGKLAFIGDELIGGNPKATAQCQKSLEEAIAKLDKLEEQVEAAQAKASKADPAGRVVALAKCERDLGVSRDEHKKCLDEGANAVSNNSECNDKLKACEWLESTFVQKINELVHRYGCTLPTDTQFATGGDLQMFSGPDGLKLVGEHN